MSYIHWQNRVENNNENCQQQRKTQLAELSRSQYFEGTAGEVRG